MRTWSSVTVLFVLAALAVSSCGDDTGDGGVFVGRGGDWVRITAKQEGGSYSFVINYSATRDRLILAAVMDARRNGRRVLRRNVSAGSGKLDWDDRRGLFTDLAQACVAMHQVTGDRRTIASDCDDF